MTGRRFEATQLSTSRMVHPRLYAGKQGFSTSTRGYRMEKNGDNMKKRVGLPGLLLLAVTVLAAPQAKAPKDPELIDMQSNPFGLRSVTAEPLSCKICDGAAALYGVVDMHRPCEIRC